MQDRDLVMQDRDLALRIALLLSALESWAFSLQKPIPDHAHEGLGAVMEDLRRIILGG